MSVLLMPPRLLLWNLELGRQKRIIVKGDVANDDAKLQKYDENGLYLFRNLGNNQRFVILLGKNQHLT